MARRAPHSEGSPKCASPLRSAALAAVSAFPHSTPAVLQKRLLGYWARVKSERDDVGWLPVVGVCVFVGGVVMICVGRKALPPKSSRRPLRGTPLDSFQFCLFFSTFVFGAISYVK